jgi:2-hydroxychromene-2-carboxylate isomerase
MQFWVAYGSTYSYLTIARIDEVAKRFKVHIDWQPMLLSPIFIEQGRPLGPFVPYPAKLNYMWLDLNRRAKLHGIPYRQPSRYPIKAARPARVALAALQGGWCPEFTRAAFKLHWTEDLAMDVDENLQAAIASCGRDPAKVLALADSSEIEAALASQVARAKSLGIFGAPTFVVGEELFWGDDRLEDALARASEQD